MRSKNLFKMSKFELMAILLFVIITGTTFTGCRQRQNAAGQGTGAVSTVTMVATSTMMTGIAEVETAVNKIVEPKINAKFKLLLLDPGAYGQQISLMMASGEDIDIIQGVPFGTTNFTVLHAQNQMLDITDMVDKYAPDLVKTANAIIPGFLEGTKVNGRLYCISGLYNKVLSDYFLARADYLDKHNIDIYSFKGLDDVGRALDILHKNEPDMVAIVTNKGDASALNMEGGAFYDDFSKPVSFDTLGDFVNRLAVVFLDDNPDKVVNIYKSDNYRKYCERVHDWFQKGYVYKDAVINTEGQETLVMNNVGITWTTGSELGVEVSKENQTGLKIRAIKADPGLISTGTMTKFFWGVTAHSKAPEAALKFLNLMYTNADICNLLAWGIEGRDYVVKADGTVNYPEGISATAVPYHTADFLWGNQFLVKVWEGNPPDLREQAKKENQNAMVSPLLGFSIDTNPIQNEITSLSNVIAQYRPGLESGMVDPAKGLPEFIKALDAAGAEKMVAEVQKQLDAWKRTRK